MCHKETTRYAVVLGPDIYDLWYAFLHEVLYFELVMSSTALLVFESIFQCGLSLICLALFQLPDNIQRLEEIVLENLNEMFGFFY